MTEIILSEKAYKFYQALRNAPVSEAEMRANQITEELPDGFRLLVRPSEHAGFRVFLANKQYVLALHWKDTRDTIAQKMQQLSYVEKEGRAELQEFVESEVALAMKTLADNLGDEFLQSMGMEDMRLSFMTGKGETLSAVYSLEKENTRQADLKQLITSLFSQIRKLSAEDQ